MYSSYANYFDPDTFNLQEMVECDMREMDFNFNDPLLQGEHILSPQDSHRLAKQDRYREHPTSSPGDLTNLQWLQNVSIPMEKGSKNQENEMMVDPNTAMPVQWTNNSHPMSQISSVTPRSVPITPVTSTIPLAQPVHARVPDLKTKIQESKSASKENTRPEDKAYPKPLFSYSCLIAMALKNSESGTLPVSEIYKFMMGKFPYFKTAPDGWKNSVRHNLSLNKAFCKLERPQGASQRKGCLWSLKPEKRAQMDKEIRKWKKKHSAAIQASMAHPEELNVSSDDLEDSSPPPHLFGQTEIIVDDKAAADAAKELFGNNLIQEIQNEELDWDEIMASSTDLHLDPTLTTTMTTTTLPIHNGTTTTTVEIDSAAHYYNGERHDYDNTSSYVPQYYTLQQQHLSVQGF